MRLDRIGVPRLIAFTLALIMVAAGVVMSRTGDERDAHAAPDAVAPRPGVVSATPEAPCEEAAVEPAAPAQPEAVEDDRPQAPAQPAEQVPPAPAPRSAPRPQTSAAPQRTPPIHSLPPFPPPEFSPSPAGAAAISGPPPGVLWLSGVIEGDPKLALFRRDQSRYLVREGDTVEGYQVAAIATNSVTLQRGGRKRTLRVGQY